MSQPTPIRGVRCTQCGDVFRSWTRWKRHECVTNDDDDPRREVPA